MDSGLMTANKWQHVFDVLVIKYEWMPGYCQMCYIHWRPAKMGSISSQEICTFTFWLTLTFSGSIRLIYAPLRQWHLIIILLQYHMVTSIKYSSTHHTVIRGFWHYFILKPYIILNIHIRPSSNCSFNNHHSVWRQT